MRCARLCALLALAGLAVAAPAGAVTSSPGIAVLLKESKTVAAPAESRATHSCQDSRSSAGKSSGNPARKFAPVACEQPPKSDVISPALSKAFAAAAAAIG